MDKGDLAQRVIALTDEAKTMGDLHKMLNEIAYTIGGMVCHFDQDERTQIVMSLTESIGMGLMLTSKSLGQPCTLEMVVGDELV